MSEYIKLATAPAIQFSSPTCGACMVDVEHTWDDWTCQVCGTSWGSDACDGTEGDLYESWSGEELDGEAVDDDAAELAGDKYRAAQRAANYKRWGWCEHGRTTAHKFPDCDGSAK